MKIFLRLAGPLGILMLLIFRLVDRDWPIPDTIGVPMMVVSCLLMMISLVRAGRLLGRNIQNKGSK